LETPEMVQRIIEKGANNWSSASEASIGTETITAGARFWIWPSDDKTYEAVSGNLTIRFHWFLRPGQKPLGPQSDEFVGAEIRAIMPGRVFVAYIPVKGIAPGEKGGIATATFDLHDARGEGKIWFSLATPRSQMRIPSNLLHMAVKVP
jgi:hypothetical protein